MKRGISYFNISLIDINALWEETHGYVHSKWASHLGPVKVVDLTNDAISAYFYHRLNDQFNNGSDSSVSTVNTMAMKFANQLAVLGIDGYVYEVMNWLGGETDAYGRSVSFELMIETDHIERSMVESVVNRDRRGDMVMVELNVDPYYLAVKLYGFKE